MTHDVIVVSFMPSCSSSGTLATSGVWLGAASASGLTAPEAISGTAEASTATPNCRRCRAAASLLYLFRKVVYDLPWLRGTFTGIGSYCAQFASLPLEGISTVKLALLEGLLLRMLSMAVVLASTMALLATMAPAAKAAGINPPARVNGIEQMPIDGVSMDYTFAADGPSTRTTQYFEILGNRAIYHDGWMASCFHGRVPWIRMQAYEFDGPQERWELYDLTTDFSQSVDLADRHPERLEHLKQLFDEEARRHGVYPLRDAGSPRGGEFSVPHSLGDVRSMTYTTAHVRMPESSVVPLRNCSWRITAQIDVPRGSEVEGVIACQGGNMSGWSLWLEAGAPRFTYNCFGHDITTLEAQALDSGRHDIVVEFAYDGGFGAGGDGGQAARLLGPGDFADGLARAQIAAPGTQMHPRQHCLMGLSTLGQLDLLEHAFLCLTARNAAGQPRDAEGAMVAAAVLRFDEGTCAPVNAR